MASRAQPLSRHFAWRTIRGVSRLAMRRVDLEVSGIDVIPAEGPCLIVARHYHHLYDGCAIVTAVPRQLQILVTLDWVRHSWGRNVMERACDLAGWPVVPRPDRPRETDDPRRAQDARRWRTALRESLDLLRAGGGLLVFPEGFPAIDPGYTPKREETDMLPFRGGFLRMVELAQRNGGTPVPIVPAGLAYVRGARWRLCLRFGQPMTYSPATDAARQLSAIEDEVRRLSGLPANANTAHLPR